MLVNIPAIIGFETNVSVQAVNFDLTLQSATVSWARVKVMYRTPAAAEWILAVVWDAGTPLNSIYDSTTDSFTASPASPLGSASRNVTIADLASDSYQVAVVIENSAGGEFSVNDVSIDHLALDTSSSAGAFKISGSSKNPVHLVAKEIELRGLPESVYDLRIWRTTEDQAGVTWQDDIYLSGYAEIISRVLAYPGHSLIGLRAMATDRLYGGRPTITSIATGAPLTVPAPAARFDTTCVTDLGMIATYQVVNGIIITGMHKVLVDAQLPEPDGSYFWLVRMDSQGFAQPDRLLTKHYLRVHTWEVVGSQTYLYVEDAEGIPPGTPLMLFGEAADPYISRHTAWTVALMLIIGSHGRITANNIDWPAFAVWDSWNMEVKASTGQPRHLFDADVDFHTDLWSIAMRVAATARGNLMRKGGKYSVWVDKATTPTQVFGEGNNANASFHPIPRSDRANILTTSFLDQTADYDQVSVSYEDVQEGEYPIVKNIPIQVGVVREPQVQDLMRFMLDLNRYVESAGSVDVGVESIEVTVGDVFILASQAKDFSLSGRIVGVVPGATVEIDQPFDPEPGVMYQLTVWATDGTICTWTGELDGAEITTLPSPAGLPASDHYEYPYVLCRLSEERMKYRCLGIRRAADTMHATLTGIGYADECYLND